MREIKFRGYTTDEMFANQWLYGFGVMDIDYVNGTKEYYLFTTHGTYEVVPESIGQFTGLTDVNGVEIYEGDIVKLVNLHEGFNGKTAKIHWNEKIPGYFYTYINEEEKYSLTKGAANHMEVIGNIHEHSHLLKENEKC